MSHDYPSYCDDEAIRITKTEIKDSTTKPQEEMHTEMKDGDFNTSIDIEPVMKINSIDSIAKKAVKKIIVNLSDRSGIGDMWDSIDSSIQKEIKDCWTKIIVDSFK